jgi:arylsulfatase A-like enzyme
LHPGTSIGHHLPVGGGAGRGKGGRGLGRRDFLRASAATALAAALPGRGRAAPRRARPSSDGPHNLLLVVTDQEAHRLLAEPPYRLPARDALAARGTSFERHYIASAMCTPSRAVMLSGQPPQVNGVFDQMELGYVPSLPVDRPSLGTIMKDLGYATAYYGKFELRRDIIRPSDAVNYAEALRAYGFDDFAPDGDKVGNPDQGYRTDQETAGMAVRWLRTNVPRLARAGTPWCLVVSFVSPHDIMYADTNLPGEDVQRSTIGGTITRPPQNRIYEQRWDFGLSPSHRDPIDGPGRPRAQLQYDLGWSAFLGTIPDARDDMWRRFYAYYLNLLRDNDRNLQMLLDAADDLDLWRDTVVVRTADHGELGGSHGGLRGKGPFPYEEMSHVPFVVAHPGQPGGRRCGAVTSHIDLVPTLVGLSGASRARREKGTTGLPGRDFSGLLADPGAAAVDAVREAALFNYVGLQTVDARYLAEVACKSIVEGRWVPSLADVHPDLSHRGFINFVCDGRFKYSRYYAPNAFNTPTTLAEIVTPNDVELFDLEADPWERTNLALEPERHEPTMLRLNALMNRLIAREVGVNDGSFLPAPVRPAARAAG